MAENVPSVPGFHTDVNGATNNRIQTLPGFTPTYDANGNLTADSLHAYTWDAEGRPVTIDGVNVTYDALGRVVEQDRSGVQTELVYSPSGALLALWQVRLCKRVACRWSEVQQRSTSQVGL